MRRVDLPALLRRLAGSGVMVTVLSPTFARRDVHPDCTRTACQAALRRAMDMDVPPSADVPPPADVPPAALALTRPAWPPTTARGPARPPAEDGSARHQPHQSPPHQSPPHQSLPHQSPPHQSPPSSSSLPPAWGPLVRGAIVPFARKRALSRAAGARARVATLLVMGAVYALVLELATAAAMVAASGHP